MQASTRPKRYISCSKEAPFLQGKIAFLNKARDDIKKFLTSTIKEFRESEFADTDEDDNRDEDLNEDLNDSSFSSSDSNEESDHD